MTTDVRTSRLSLAKWEATTIVGNIQFTATGLTRTRATKKVAKCIRSINNGDVR
jgi:hypothetical protein